MATNFGNAASRMVVRSLLDVRVSGSCYPTSTLPGQAQIFASEWADRKTLNCFTNYRYESLWNVELRELPLLESQ